MAGPVRFFDHTPVTLPTPKAKFRGAPQLTDARGGHTINLHQFARDGVRLLGRLRDVQDGKLLLAPDLHDNLLKADQFEAEAVKLIDAYIKRNGQMAPEEELPHLHDGFAVEAITELDLDAAGIRRVVWAMGYTFDYSLVRMPVTDGDGYPVQQRGVTRFPGLYFIGMPWLSNIRSGFIMGASADAAYIVEYMASHKI